MDDIEKVILEIEKKFGKGIILRGKDITNFKIEKIPTGSLWLDYSLEGGLPRGRTVEFFGPPASGKSLIAQRTVAEAQKKGETCVWIDAENAFNPDFAKQLGVNIDKLILVRASEGEFIFNIIEKFLKTKPAIIVVDSVASLVPMFEAEEPIEKQTMALQARLMSKALRKITGQVARANTLLIFINQVREKVGVMFRSPEVTSGGRALGFYASVRIEIRRGEWITTSEDKKTKVGQVIKFNIVKSKVSVPYRTGSFRYFFKGIIDENDELISLLEYTKKIERNGAFYQIEGKSYQGKTNLSKAIKQDKNLKDKLIRRLYENR